MGGGLFRRWSANGDRSQYAYERKEAIQKTIMSMTLGKDVSALFPDVLKNIATQDLDQKKLVYLYLMYVASPTCMKHGV